MNAYQHFCRASMQRLLSVLRGIVQMPGGSMAFLQSASPASKTTTSSIPPKQLGPNAPLGEMDYVVEGINDRGFAPVAAPSEYGETAVETFIVSQDGVAY